MVPEMVIKIGKGSGEIPKLCMGSELCSALTGKLKDSNMCLLDWGQKRLLTLCMKGTVKVIVPLWNFMWQICVFHR